MTKFKVWQAVAALWVIATLLMLAFAEPATAAPKGGTGKALSAAARAGAAGANKKRSASDVVVPLATGFALGRALEDEQSETEGKDASAAQIAIESAAPQTMMILDDDPQSEAIGSMVAFIRHALFFAVVIAVGTALLSGFRHVIVFIPPLILAGFIFFGGPKIASFVAPALDLPTAGPGPIPVPAPAASAPLDFIFRDGWPLIIIPLVCLMALGLGRVILAEVAPPEILPRATAMTKPASTSPDTDVAVGRFVLFAGEQDAYGDVSWTRIGAFATRSEARAEATPYKKWRIADRENP